MARWDNVSVVEDWGRFIAGTAQRPESALDPRDVYAAQRYAVAVLEVVIDREIRHRRDDLARVRSYTIAADTIGVSSRMMDAGRRLAALLADDTPKRTQVVEFAAMLVGPVPGLEGGA